VILTAAVRADAGVPLQRGELAAVLDAGVVSGGVETGADIPLPRRMFVELADAPERDRDRDDERARAAHA
jgi:hypothetical protein